MNEPTVTDEDRKCAEEQERYLLDFGGDDSHDDRITKMATIIARHRQAEREEFERIICELRKDSVRVDWMEKLNGEVSAYGDGTCTIFFVDLKNKTIENKTVRDAIDTAIKEVFE